MHHPGQHTSPHVPSALNPSPMIPCSACAAAVETRSPRRGLLPGRLSAVVAPIPASPGGGPVSEGREQQGRGWFGGEQLQQQQHPHVPEGAGGGGNAGGAAAWDDELQEFDPHAQDSDEDEGGGGGYPQRGRPSQQQQALSPVRSRAGLQLLSPGPMEAVHAGLAALAPYDAAGGSLSPRAGPSSQAASGAASPLKGPGAMQRLPTSSSKAWAASQVDDLDLTDLHGFESNPMTPMRAKAAAADATAVTPFKLDDDDDEDHRFGGGSGGGRGGPSSSFSQRQQRQPSEVRLPPAAAAWGHDGDVGGAAGGPADGAASTSQQQQASGGGKSWLPSWLKFGGSKAASKGKGGRAVGEGLEGIAGRPKRAHGPGSNAVAPAAARGRRSLDQGDGKGHGQGHATGAAHAVPGALMLADEDDQKGLAMGGQTTVRLPGASVSSNLEPGGVGGADAVPPLPAKQRPARSLLHQTTSGSAANAVVPNSANATPGASMRERTSGGDAGGADRPSQAVEGVKVRPRRARFDAAVEEEDEAKKNAAEAEEAPGMGRQLLNMLSGRTFKSQVCAHTHASPRQGRRCLTRLRCSSLPPQQLMPARKGG